MRELQEIKNDMDKARILFEKCAREVDETGFGDPNDVKNGVKKYFEVLDNFNKAQCDLDGFIAELEFAVAATRKKNGFLSFFKF